MVVSPVGLHGASFACMRVSAGSHRPLWALVRRVGRVRHANVPTRTQALATFRRQNGAGPSALRLKGATSPQAAAFRIPALSLFLLFLQQIISGDIVITAEILGS